MKRILCLLIAILLIGVMAFAEIPDVSGLTDEELLELKAQVDQTVSDKDLVKEFSIGTGTYICGESIKPGTYTLRSPKENGHVKISVFLDSEHFMSSEPLFDEFFATYDDTVEIVYTFTISEGQVLKLELKSGEAKITKAETIG